MIHLPLLQIPFVAQMEILKHVDIFDLITLSICSSRTKNLVKYANIRLDHLDFRFNGSKDLRIYVSTHFRMSCSQETDLKVIWTDTREVAREVVLFERVSDSVKELLTGLVMGTFRKVKCISICSYKTSIRNLPVWKFTKTIDSLSSIAGSEEKLSQEELKFIFQELTIIRNLKICPSVHNGFQFSERFKPKRVCIPDAKWVMFDAILKSKCQYISLDLMERPSAAELNNLLKMWMSKQKMKHLKCLRLGLRPGPQEFTAEFLTEVLDGIVHERRESKMAEVQRIDGRRAKVQILFDVFCFKIRS